jgi:hypothetical protein
MQGPLPMQNNVILVALVFAMLQHASNPFYILGTSYGLLSKYDNYTNFFLKIHQLWCIFCTKNLGMHHIGFFWVTKWQKFAPKNRCLRVGMAKQSTLYVGCGKH